MMLRLVLVGMVAALGVSIPSKPGPERWFDSAETWATSLLAAWDTWEPTDGDENLPAGKRDHLDCEECRLARIRLAANAMRAVAGDPPAPNSVAFEPIRVSEPFESDIARELNLVSEELDSTAVTSNANVATATNTEPPLPADAFEIAEWDELYPDETAPLEVVKPVNIGSFDDELSSCFDEDGVQGGCLDEAQAAWEDAPVLADLPRDVFAPGTPAVATAPFWKPLAVPGFGTLACLAPRASNAAASSDSPAVDGPESARAVTLVELPRQVFAPLPEPVAEPRSTRGLLVDLPRDVFAPAPVVISQEPLQTNQSLAGTHTQPARLGDAVELTRRAVSAWVSVLIGPALVDVSRR
jgi:hypothetical protein